MNDIIRQRYPFEPTKKIADDLGLSESSVYNRAGAWVLRKILYIFGLHNSLQDI
jgi:DNA-binding Lrp family transcriptional regulator